MTGEGSGLLLPPCDPSRPYTLKCIFQPSDPLWLQEGPETRARLVPECSVRVTVTRASTRIDWTAPVLPIPCGVVLTSDLLCARVVWASDIPNIHGDLGDKGSDKHQDKGSALTSRGLTSVASRGLLPVHTPGPGLEPGLKSGLAMSLVRYRLVETNIPLHVGVSVISQPGIYTIR